MPRDHHGQRSDQADIVAEHLAWMRGQGWSVEQALEAIGFLKHVHLATWPRLGWDDVALAYGRAHRHISETELDRVVTDAADAAARDIGAKPTQASQVA